MYVVLSIFTLILLLVSGAMALTVKNTSTAVAAEAISRLMAATAFFAGGLLIIPRYKFEFESFGLELSTAARWLILVSDVTVRYWYLLAFPIVLLLATDICLMFFLHRQPERRHSARLFSGILSLVILLALFIAVAAIGQSLLALSQSLA